MGSKVTRSQRDIETQTPRLSFSTHGIPPLCLSFTDSTPEHSPNPCHVHVTSSSITSSISLRRFVSPAIAWLLNSFLINYCQGSYRSLGSSPVSELAHSTFRSLRYTQRSARNRANGHCYPLGGTCSSYDTRKHPQYPHCLRLMRCFCS